MKTNSSHSTLSSPWVYFGLALGWSWLFWILAIVLGGSAEAPLGLLLGLVGFPGPMIAGIVSTYLVYGKEGRRDYWLRLIDVRRIGLAWYAVILLFVPALFALAVGLDVLLGGRGGTWEEPALQLFAAPWLIVSFVFSIRLIGPLEEFGWRGHVLDRLQARWGALAASLILGVVWSLWHLPLFFIEGTYQHSLGAGTPAFWLFMIGIVPLSVVFSWIFNNTRRSTLGAMLFHFVVNFTGELVALTPRAEFISIVLWTVAAIAVATTWGTRRAAQAAS